MHLTVPVIGILRGITQDIFGSLMQASFTAGLQALEVTYNTPGAEKIIASNLSLVPPEKHLGMGTIRNLTEAERAVDAGAMFLVTPNVDPEVIEFGRSKNTPVIAGALTPTEVYQASEAGATMVKIFPCGTAGGPQYIRELRGPFSHVPMMAVGGVTVDNVRDYLLAGASGVGVGISLFGEKEVAARNWQGVQKNVGKFIDRCTKA